MRAMQADTSSSSLLNLRRHHRWTPVTARRWNGMGGMITVDHDEGLVWSITTESEDVRTPRPVAVPVLTVEQPVLLAGVRISAERKPAEHTSNNDDVSQSTAPQHDCFTEQKLRVNHRHLEHTALTLRYNSTHGERALLD